MLPDTPRSRLEWTVKESLVFLGVLLFWVAVFVVVALVLGLFALPYQLLGEPAFRPLVEVARVGDDLRAAVIPLTLLSSSLYVLVRAGMLLIDHYADTRPDRVK